MQYIIYFRENVLNIYKKCELPLNYIVKFILGFIIFSMITKLGNVTVLNKMTSKIFLSILVAITPATGVHFIIICAVTLQLFYTSIELSLIVFVFLIIVFLFYIRVFPKQSLLSIAILLCYYFKIPYVIPLFAGLYIGLSGVVPTICGIFIWDTLPVLDELFKLSPTSSFSLIGMLDAFMNLYVTIMGAIKPNQIWIAIALVFTMAILVVHLISIFTFDYSKQIAVAAGGLLLLIGQFIISATYSAGVLGPIFGIIFSVLIVICISFLDVVLDYKRSEKVKFEDNNYVYYVKAIPKIKNLSGSKSLLDSARMADDESPAKSTHQTNDPPIRNMDRSKYKNPENSKIRSTRKSRGDF